jgi:hypothetical protein
MNNKILVVRVSCLQQVYLTWMKSAVLIPVTNHCKSRPIIWMG